MRKFSSNGFNWLCHSKISPSFPFGFGIPFSFKCSFLICLTSEFQALVRNYIGCKMAGRKDKIFFGFKFGMKWDFCLNSIEAVNKGMKTLKMFH